MRFFQSILFFPALLWLSLGGCSGFAFFSNGHVLVAVTINPTIADPINFPNQQVQFTASGTFNNAPIVVNPLGSVIWTVDRSAFSTAPDLGHASISQNGLARCTPGFTGMVQVIATVPADPSLSVSPSNSVVAVAQMHCP